MLYLKLTMEKKIEIHNLTKVYPLNKGKISLAAVNNISFFVNSAEIFGILGPNGAGKTTTLEIIECLKPQTSGEVLVLGMDNKTNQAKIKQKIGVQLQSSEYLPYLSLKELLELFASLYNTKIDALKLLTEVSLEKRANETYKNLSGGQKQRFTIATSLVNKPEIIFLDEPTTGLDPSARRKLWQLIKKLNQEGLTIVLTTHYMEEAEFLCNRVAIMDEGKILEIDEPKKLVEKTASTTQVSFFVSREINSQIFQSLSEVEKVYSKYPKIILEIKSLEHVNKIVEILKNHQINFSGFTVKTASLEDVYLDLTGKEYENE